MPRLLKSPNSGTNIVNIITPEQGGHGKKTADAVLSAMNLVPRNRIGMPSFPIPLDGEGKFDSSHLSELYACIENVTGDLTIEVNKTKEYFLTSYDSFVKYDIVPISGTLEVDRNVITYKAGPVAGPGGFTVNGRAINITIVDAVAARGVKAPLITSPVRGDTGKTVPVTITTAPYSSDNGETHRSTTWQCSETPDFAVVAFTATQSMSALTTWVLNSLQLGKQYFVRARFHGSGGSTSPWSAVSHFATMLPIPAEKPGITSPVNGATKLPSKILLTSTPYQSATGDVHVSSSWQISESPLFTSLIFDLQNSVASKTSCQVTGLLAGKEYYARVRYRGEQHGYTEWSTPTHFRTRYVFLPVLEVGSIGNYDAVSADMSDNSASWIVGNGLADTLGSAYIYKKIGLIPALDQRIAALSGARSLNVSVPAGGNVSVAVSGQYVSNKNYTQAEDVTIPAGARSLTLTGKGGSPSEISEYMVGVGVIQLPSAVSTVTIRGVGGAGSTTSNPGQPYIESKPEVPMSATGTFPIVLNGVSVTGVYHAEFSSIPQVDNTSYLTVKNLQVTGITGSYTMELLTNSLGELPASYASRQELVRIVSAENPNVMSDNFVAQILAGSPSTAEQPYVPPSTVTTIGTDTVIVVNGQTYTYAGGNGGPATPRADTITLTGDRTISYNVSVTGSARYSYPSLVPMTQPLTGTGEYVLPFNTTAIRITGKGGDGSTIVHPEVQTVEQVDITSSGSGTFSHGTVTFTAEFYRDSLLLKQSVVTWPNLIQITEGAAPGDYEKTTQTTTNLTPSLATSKVTGTSTMTYRKVGSTETADFTVNLLSDTFSSGTLGVPYSAGYTEYVEGSPSTFVIQGNTYTFNGGYGVPATEYSQEVVLDGSDLSLSYSIATGGSGSVKYNLTSTYNGSFSGIGYHPVPSDVGQVSILGRGGAGTPAVGERLEFTEKSSDVSLSVAGPSGNLTAVFPSRIYINNPPEQITVNPDASEVLGGLAQANYVRSFVETVDGVDRKVVEYIHSFDAGEGMTNYVVHYRAYAENVLLPKSAMWVNPAISTIFPLFKGKVGTIRWTHPTSGSVYHAVTGSIYFENFYADPDEIVSGETVVKCSYRVMNNGVLIDKGRASFRYVNSATFSGAFTHNNLAGMEIKSSMINQAGYASGTRPSVSTGTSYAGNWFTDTYDGRTIYFYPNVVYAYRAARPDLRTPAKTGESTSVTFNGQTYVFEGGVGGPATPRIERINVLPGFSKPLNYSVGKNGIVTVGYQTLSEISREATVVIDGQTYTFPGSTSGAATETTHVVNLVSNHHFGNDVAMSDDGTTVAVCVSPKTAISKGYVLVFKKNGSVWEIVDELHRDDGYVWNAQSVSMDGTGEHILVGASSQPSGSGKVGSFAVYKRVGYRYVVEQIILAPNNGVAYEAGRSVSISKNGSRFVVGAPVGGVGSSALIYGRDDNGVFVLESTFFKTTDPNESDTFGSVVAISSSGNVVAVSSPTSRSRDLLHQNSGVVFVFKKNATGWVLHNEVHHHTEASDLYFGKDIHLSDDGGILSVGCPGGNAGFGEVLFFDVETQPAIYKSTVRSTNTTSDLNLGKAIALPGNSGDLVAISKVGSYLFD